MKHEFTDSEITVAADQAVDTASYYRTIPIDYHKAFLDALPEPEQDEWEECDFNDFRPTDKRVKAFFIGGSIIEGTPDRRNSEHVFLVDGPVIHSYGDATFYRIPAPVQHPDPAEHPVIVNVAVEKPGTNSTHRYDYATWDAEDYYLCWNKGGKYYGGWQASTITEWEPAKVVPKVVADDEM